MALSLCASMLSLSISTPFNGGRLLSGTTTPMALQLKKNDDLSGSFSGSSLSVKENQSLSLYHFPAQKHSSLIVFSAKKKKDDYKRKNHKSSKKRFRVTGSGKIIRRCAGRQHFLRKKSMKRKKRLSGLVKVHKSNYANITGAMPYLKVNRRPAT